MCRAHALRLPNLEVIYNLHVFLWKIRSDTVGIQIEELQNDKLKHSYKHIYDNSNQNL